MKRAGNLWDKITDLENIKLAHKLARKGKAFYKEVKMVDADIDHFAREVQKMLIEKTFTTAEYKVGKIFDGRKYRTIYKLPYYPDRIVQHALLNIVGPILVKGFIRDTFQSIQGRGTHDAMKRLKAVVRAPDAPQFALKIDIQKYYPSINNALMKKALYRKVKCPGALWLLVNIIDSIEGLPIGNFTSQHLGNLYLSDFDWWIKQVLRPRAYFRYCDDICIFADTREELETMRQAMFVRLEALLLTVKADWQVYEVVLDGVDFVGFVFKPQYTLLRANIAKGFKKACRRAKKNRSPNTLSSLMAYKGWCRYSNAKGLWRTHASGKLKRYFPKQIRGTI